MRTLFPFVLCLPLFVDAQSWFPPEAVWHYWYSGTGNVAGFVRIEQVGDSVINEQPCRILRKTQEGVDLVENSYFTEALGRECAYAQDGLVMAFDPALDAFDTLYNMNAVPGDNWQHINLPNQGSACGALNNILVTDTGRTTIDGINLRWLAVDINYEVGEGVWQANADTIIERIGTIGSYLLPQDWCNGFLDGHEAGPFRCYADADIFYIGDEDVPCELTTGQQEFSQQTSIGLHPNPNIDGAFLSLPNQAKNAAVQLFDGTGRIAYSGELFSGAWLDVSSLPSGMYLVRIDSGDLPSPYFGRWVKS